MANRGSDQREGWMRGHASPASLCATQQLEKIHESAPGVQEQIGRQWPGMGRVVSWLYAVFLKQVVVERWRRLINLHSPSCRN